MQMHSHLHKTAQENILGWRVLLGAAEAIPKFYYEQGRNVLLKM